VAIGGLDRHRPASGIYFVRVESPAGVAGRKIALIQ